MVTKAQLEEQNRELILKLQKANDEYLELESFHEDHLRELNSKLVEVVTKKRII